MGKSNSKLLQVVKYVLFTALAVLLVYLAFRKVDWKVFLEGLGQTRWLWVVLFIVFSVLALVGRTIRWKELLNPFDDSIGYLRIWDANNIGNLASVALPGSGEVLRCGLISTKKLEFDKALGTMFCERIWDAIALIVILAASLILQWDRFGTYFTEKVLEPMASAGIWWIVALVLAAVAAFIILVFRLRTKSRFCGRIADSLSRFWVGIMAFSKSRNKFLVAITTFFIWFMYILMCFCIIKAMPALDGLDLADATFLSMVGNLASVVPVPGGIGAYHYLVSAALGLYGYSWDTGILFSTLNHEIHAVLIIFLGVISYLSYLGWRSRKDKKDEA